MSADRVYVNRWWAVPLRLFLGVMWLYAAFEKTGSGFESIHRIVQVMAYGEPSGPGGNPIGWFRTFLSDVVLPHWRIFGVLILLGEFSVGISLLFGILTRLGALGGVFLFIQYGLGRAYLEWAFTYPALIAPHIALIWTAAGRTLGVDAWLAKKKPGWLIW